MKRVDELLRLDGRVALITGGAGHIALAFAEAFAELGARLVLADREGEALQARAEDLAVRLSADVRTIACDLGEPGAGKALAEQGLAAFGELDILVNNAAFTGASGLPGYAVPFAEQTADAFAAAVQVNLNAAFELSHAAAPALARSGRGTILNVASIYGMLGPNMGLYTGTRMGNPAAYAASKGGLIQLTRYLATVLAPAVRVNCISPGGIARGQAPAFVERYEALTPLGRMGCEEDLKGAAAFLAGDAAGWITGQNIAVDGGWSAW